MKAPSPSARRPPRGLTSSPLEAFFRPRSVALVGATEAPGSVGRALLGNLLTGRGREVFPVNPKRPKVLGRRAYAGLRQLPARPDLAVVAVPAAAVPGVIGDCASLGVPAAIVISAGFRETGAAGAALEEELLARAGGRVRIVGPNCLGVLCPPAGLNASFAGVSPRPGRIAFLSQSGALGTAVLDWSLREKVGFSAFVSVGSMLDVGWGELIDHFGRDAGTDAILIYMESVGDARAFLSAAREAALDKPIIVLKAGRTEASARAAASHTGALAGSDAVLDAAFRRCGVTRVGTIAELFHLADALGKQPRPRGGRLAVLTNAGGPAVLAVDALIEAGGRPAELAPSTMEALSGFLPAAWSHGNPVDILGDADAERYAKALSAVAADPGADGLLAVLTPQAMTAPAATARALAKAAKGLGKPVLASWMGADSVKAGREALAKAGIPVFAYPDTAARVFGLMWRHAENLRSLYETPALSAGAEEGVDLAAARGVLSAVRAEGRTLLTEDESKRLLAAYGLPAVDTRFAPDEASAVRAAAEFPGPVVLKLRSKTITHKSDVGGVRLHLSGEPAVRAAFAGIRSAVEKAGAPFEGVTVQPMVRREGIELILGAHTDPQFGPVILFGAGGRMVEVHKDFALGLPPLNTTLARRLMEGTKVHRALHGVRGEPSCDLGALEKLLVRFSRLMAEQKWIKEMDVNPLLASPQGFIALDARVVLFDPAAREEDLPAPAIRPYPSQYAGTFRMKDGQTVSIRPIRPEDEPLVAEFHKGLSERSVYMRYLAAMKLDRRVAHERLSRVCFSDHDRELALVAERRDPASRRREVMAVGRLSRARLGAPSGEASLLVADAWQGRGLGTELLRRLLDAARREGLSAVTAEVLAENLAMQRLCGKQGFRIAWAPGARVVKAELKLTGGEP
jgi:acetyltransferase